MPALAGRTIEEGNEETKIDLTYSATNGISRTGPPLGMPILRIIQVSANYTIDALRLNRPHLVELRRRIQSLQHPAQSIGA